MTRYTVTDNQTYTAGAYDLTAADTLLVSITGNMVGQYSSGPLISAADTFIQNNGSISNIADCIDMSNSTLANNGFITSSSASGGISATSVIFVTSGTNVITNAGVIADYDPSIFSSALFVGNGVTTSLINTGTISSTGGRTISTDGVLTVENYGNILGGLTYNAINVTTGGKLTLENYGNLHAATGTAAIYASISNNAQTITNYGQITGNLRFGASADAITNDGTIKGNIDLGNGDNIVINHHLIDGPVNGFDGVDTFTNSGTITGDVGLGAGNDTLTNTYGVITGNIIGGLGNDTVNGGAQKDVIYGDDLAGTDTSGGADSLFGFYGDDVIHGGFGNDTIQGNQGNDVLYGDAGNDFLHGGQDSDQLYGGDGDDILNGGLGADVLTGGAGNDTFTYALNFGRDTITDFSAVSGNNDVIRFQAGTFANYADVQSHMEQQGANVVIELNVNDSVVLLNTTTAALTSDHFIFG